MKPTTKIRFTEPQIALVMRAHPKCNLDHLTELSFEFDHSGKIIDCTGTIKDGGNIDHDYAGSGLARLYETARRQFTARQTNATVLQFPSGRPTYAIEPACQRSAHPLNNRCASRVGLTPSPTCLPGQGGSRKGDAAIRQRNGSCESSALLGQTDGGSFMSKKRETKVASDGGPDITSAGVPWSEVPEFARADVAWIDGRHGSAQSSLPPVNVVPVPDILYRLPYLHEDRPRGSKAMLDAAGARARLRDVRPGAWLISPFSGWKWAKWPSGDVGWLPTDIELPATLQVMARRNREACH